MKVFVAVSCLALAGLLYTAPAFGQKVHQRSRHESASDINKLFDPQQAEELLSPGEGSLSGILKLGYKPGLLRKKQIIYADREIVYLFPMTSYTQAWLEKWKDDMTLGMVFLAPEATMYTARTFTDRQGKFQFRGLKPGKYFFHAAVPYAVDGVRREDTGNRKYSINYMAGTATSSPIYKETDVKLDLEQKINVVVEVKAGVPTVLDTDK